MVAKYSKLKNQTTSHKDQMRAEQEKLRLLDEEHEAYQALLRISNRQPVPGHYRTRSGSHMKIVSNGSSWARQGVSAEEQKLPFGFMWVPYPSIGQTGRPMTIQELYFNGDPMYQIVMPKQVGFSNLGDHINQYGATYTVYQLNKLAVVENGANNVGYQAVSINRLDHSREHIRVYKTGAIEVVPPLPEAYRSLALLPQHQPQPALAQQILQLAAAQPFVAGPSQIPADSFEQAAVPQMWIDDDGRSRSNTSSSTLSGNSNFTNGTSHISEASLLQNVDMNNFEGNGAKMGGLEQSSMGLDLTSISDLDLENSDFDNLDLGDVDLSSFCNMEF